MKKILINLIFIIFLLSLAGCINKKEKLLEKYSTEDTAFHQNDAFNETNQEILYKKNLVNMKNNFPFFIIRLEAPLFKKKPENCSSIPDEYYMLKYGDVVYPVREKNPTKYFFQVKTIDGRYGWIYNGCGISVNHIEDPNLYFFTEEYYLKRYKEAEGKIDNSNKLILAKNIVPLLLGNFKSDGWFYPNDYKLALQISNYCMSIVENKSTRFYAGNIVYNWNYSEILIANNLLADSYQKLKFLDKAEMIHQDIIKKYFWKSYDNSPLIGGLNSIVKLELIYIEQLSEVSKGSDRYKEIEEKIIENAILVGDKYNTLPALDKEWPNLTFAEWLVDLLRRNLPRDEFYAFAKKISTRSTSSGFTDMINIYVAIEMYQEDRKEEALEILTNYKPKHKFKSYLRINDWLSINKIIPDSIIYQYNRF